ncbi:Spindle assembly checkpoint kinase [Pelomyxa schiedti]|nr:Spindle assembly checkpoint kinase [Pelomyxa schiedti]
MIDQYKSGEFGRVYRGQLERAFRQNTDVAIKVIDVEKVHQKAPRDFDIYREYDLLQRLSPHVNFPTPFGFKMSKNSRWFRIVMERIKGETLAQIGSDQAKILPETSIKMIARQILKALHHMHVNHITHRDLKPENIMIKCDQPLEIEGSVKVIDLGFANYTEVLKTTCGTFSYKAPEIVEKREALYSEKVDLWSLGATTFFGFFGKVPFDNRTAETVAFEKVNFNSVDPTGTRCSTLARDFITKLLVYNPTQRPSAAEALSHAWFRVDDTQPPVQARQGQQLASLRSTQPLQPLPRSRLLLPQVNIPPPPGAMLLPKPANVTQPPRSVPLTTRVALPPPAPTAVAATNSVMKLQERQYAATRRAQQTNALKGSHTKCTKGKVPNTD